MSNFAIMLSLSFAMSLVALIGSLTFLLPKNLFDKIILPLVALSAGTLIGGSFFHLLPESIDKLNNSYYVYIFLTAGFITFFILEQFLHWHHCHLSPLQHKPVSYLILIADGLHNLIDGILFGAAFIFDPHVAIILWIMLVLHEIPQELGDFGILIFSNWSRDKAILYNLISALTFPVGAVLSYYAAINMNITGILPFAAGSFIYIGAVDLIPQLRSTKLLNQIIQFSTFLFGIFFMYILKILPT